MDNPAGSVDGLCTTGRHGRSGLRGVTGCVGVVTYSRRVTTSEQPRMMTGPEVCGLLHIGKTTLNDWRDRGDVEAVPLPRRGWRYPSNQPVIERALAALSSR